MEQKEYKYRKITISHKKVCELELLIARIRSLSNDIDIKKDTKLYHLIDQIRYLDYFIKSIKVREAKVYYTKKEVK